MTTSIDLFNDIVKFNLENLEPHYTAPDEMYVALQTRLNNEAEVTKQLAGALALMPCGCRREYPYHGKGVAMCVRCRALVLWEVLTTGTSVIQIEFEKDKPK